VQNNYQRLFAIALLLLILAAAALAYLPMVFDNNYQGEDYMFLSQVTRYGFLASIVLSWKDHFIPLFRIIWGGLYLLSDNAAVFRMLILGFHFVNAALIYRIVRNATKSAALAAVSSVTFVFSQQAASSVVWCINGHWGMSLCFVLLMSICFERFLKDNTPPDTQAGELSQHAGSPAVPFAGQQPWRMKFYYLGLVCFVVALGFFTVSLAGGTVIWLFMYARLIRKERFRRNIRSQ